MSLLIQVKKGTQLNQFKFKIIILPGIEIQAFLVACTSNASLLYKKTHAICRKQNNSDMSIQILTKDDLHQFKLELFEELKGILPQTENPFLKRWLKSDEVKKLLKVSPGTLQTLRINGTLSYTKLGGIIYYDYEHIEKILRQNLQVATKPIG